MYNRTVCGAFVVIIGFIALVDLGVAYAQVEGAVQYPPPSVGEDAQPPPPARMVPKIVLPRQLELGISGSGQAPTNPPYWIGQGADWRSMQPAPLSGGSSAPHTTRSGND
jgi:hypothetical protein